MKNWFKRLGYKFQSWMQGRYGQDELNNALLVIALILLLLSHIPGLMHLYILSLAALIWSMVRCYSRKLDKRRGGAGRISSLYRPHKGLVCAAEAQI